jgi:N-acetylmuramoyl-L-alanine amidase
VRAGARAVLIALLLGGCASAGSEARPPASTSSTLSTFALAPQQQTPQQQTPQQTVQTSTVTTVAAPTVATTTTTHPAVSTSAIGALAGRIVVLDPGHNGANGSHPAQIGQLVNVVTEMKACDTAGTQTPDGYTESAYNFDVATRTAGILRAAGATVILTRPDNAGVGPCITQRAAIGNQAHAGVAISIHADGGPPWGRGFHVIEPAPIAGYNAAIVPASDAFALDVRRDYGAATGMPVANYVATDGLITRSDLGGLNLSTVPKVFIECGNMQNTTDASLLEDPAFRQKAATGIARAISDFLLGPPG